MLTLRADTNHQFYVWPLVLLGGIILSLPVQANEGGEEASKVGEKACLILAEDAKRDESKLTDEAKQKYEDQCPQMRGVPLKPLRAMGDAEPASTAETPATAPSQAAAETPAAAPAPTPETRLGAFAESSTGGNQAQGRMVEATERNNAAVQNWREGIPSPVPSPVPTPATTPPVAAQAAASPAGPNTANKSVGTEMGSMAQARAAEIAERHNPAITNWREEPKADVTAPASPVVATPAAEPLPSTASFAQARAAEIAERNLVLPQTSPESFRSAEILPAEEMFKPAAPSQPAEAAPQNPSSKLPSFAQDASGARAAEQISQQQAARETLSRQPTMEGIVARGKMHGLSANAAAAFAGNFVQESRLNPNARGDRGTAFGLAQWRNDRAEGLANHLGVSQLNRNTLANTFTQQVDYAMSTDLKAQARMFPQLRELYQPNISLERATELVARYYERPQRVGSELFGVHGGQNRFDYAQTALSQYTGGLYAAPDMRNFAGSQPTFAPTGGYQSAQVSSGNYNQVASLSIGAYQTPLNSYAGASADYGFGYGQALYQPAEATPVQVAMLPQAMPQPIATMPASVAAQPLQQNILPLANFPMAENFQAQAFVQPASFNGANRLPDSLETTTPAYDLLLKGRI